MDYNSYRITVASQRFVDGVIDHLKHHVVQTCTIVGVTDIHPGAFPYGIQAFQDLNTRRVVTLL